MYYDPMKIADSILHENVLTQMCEFFFKCGFTPLISVPNIRCLSSILLASYCHTVEIRKNNFFLRRILFYSWGKVNSVQEACAKCFAVHILRFEILQTT